MWNIFFVSEHQFTGLKRKLKHTCLSVVCFFCGFSVPNSLKHTNSHLFFVYLFRRVKFACILTDSVNTEKLVAPTDFTSNVKLCFYCEQLIEQCRIRMSKFEKLLEVKNNSNFANCLMSVWREKTYIKHAYLMWRPVIRLLILRNLRNLRMSHSHHKLVLQRWRPLV